MFRHWFFSHPRIHLKAAWEATFIVGCGLIAFPFLLLIRLVQQAAGGATLPTLYMWDTIKSGQLFPFSFGLSGIILWLVSREFKGKGIPLRSLVILFLFLAYGACVIVYAIQPDMNHPLPPIVVITSIAILGVYYILHYY